MTRTPGGYESSRPASDLAPPPRGPAPGAHPGDHVTLSGDAEHVYVTDPTGRIVSTHDDLDAAKAAMRCACRGTRRLSRAVIDGGHGWVTCPWCADEFGREAR